VPRPFPGPEQERQVRRQVSWLAGQGLMHAFPGCAFAPLPSGRPLPGKGHVHRAHRLQLQGQPRIRRVTPRHRIPFQAPRGAPARVCRSAGFGARPLAWRAAIANRFARNAVIANMMDIGDRSDLVPSSIEIGRTAGKFRPSRCRVRAAEAGDNDAIRPTGTGTAWNAAPGSRDQRFLSGTCATEPETGRRIDDDGDAIGPSARRRALNPAGGGRTARRAARRLRMRAFDQPAAAR